MNSANMSVTGGTVTNLYVAGESDPSVTGTINDVKLTVGDNATVTTLSYGNNGGVAVDPTTGNINAEDVKVSSSANVGNKDALTDVITTTYTVKIDGKEIDPAVREYTFADFSKFENEEFIDGVTISNEEFYKKLVSSNVSPTTSQATPDRFEKVFKEAVDDGYDVVAITISSTLSGTCQSANIAADEYVGKIFVVDSYAVTIAGGILAELALKLAEQGLSAKEIAENLEKAKSNIRLVALFDTLEYLKRGGRISKATAFAGGLLNIKPIIGIKDGEITVLGKARGSRLGNQMIVEEIKKYGDIDFTKPVLLGYTGSDQTLLQNFVSENSSLWDTTPNITDIGSVVGTHAGPGAFAIAYFIK